MRMRRIILLMAVIVAAGCASDSDGQAASTAPTSSSASDTSAATTATSATSAPATTDGTAPDSTTEPSETVTTLATLDGLAYEEVAAADFPSVLTALPDWDDALLAERGGIVRWLGAGSVVLDIADRISLAGEGGLLGMAIHPDGDRLFVHYSDVSGNTVVSGFGFDGEMVDEASEQVLLEQQQPASNHNGGMIQFGPDGALYLGLGDGGASGDRFGNGQNTDTLLGGLVRLDVDSGDSALWQYGLRNPWRFWIEGDDIWIADVGQGAHEEVNVAPIGSEGLNYGWPITEGLACYESSDCDRDGLTEPILDIEHGDAGTCSVTGGIVYSGAAIPELAGRFFYSDYCGGYLRSVNADGEVIDHTDDVGVAGQVVSFGIDGDGEMYVLTTGSVLRVVPVR